MAGHHGKSSLFKSPWQDNDDGWRPLDGFLCGYPAARSCGQLLLNTREDNSCSKMVSHPKFAKIRTGMKRGARVPDAVRHLVIKKWNNSIPHKEIVEQLEHVLSVKSVQRIIAQEIADIKSGKKPGILPPFVEEIEAKKLSRKLNNAKRALESGRGREDTEAEGETELPLPSVEVGGGDSTLYWKKSKEGVRLIHVLFDLMPQFLAVYGRTNESLDLGEVDEDEFWQQVSQLFNNRDYRPVPLPIFITDPHFTGSAKNFVMDPVSAPKKPWPKELLLQKFRDLQRMFYVAKARWDRSGGGAGLDPFDFCWERRHGRNVWPDAYYLLRVSAAEASQEISGFSDLLALIESTAPAEARCEDLICGQPDRPRRPLIDRPERRGRRPSPGNFISDIPLSAFS